MIQQSAIAPSDKADIIRGLYLGILQREPDAAGLANWIAAWDTGMSLDDIARALVGSPEAGSNDRASRRASESAADSAADVALPAAVALLQSLPLVIVDVGAQNLAAEDHVYSRLALGSVPLRIIGFEPLEHRRLERLQDAGAGLTLLPAFIGDGATHTFHVNEPDATSSLLPFDERITSQHVHLDGLRTVRTEPAATTTLDLALQGEPRVDFLKLDIQGFELPALQHADAVLRRTQVVHCEVSFMQIYRGQALFSEVEQHMRGRGFDLIDLAPLCRYPVVGSPYTRAPDRLGWADAVFFRSPVDGEGWRDVLVRSLIALAVYRKPSLAAALAQRLQGTPADAYARALLRH